MFNWFNALVGAEVVTIFYLVWTVEKVNELSARISRLEHPELGR